MAEFSGTFGPVAPAVDGSKPSNRVQTVCRPLAPVVDIEEARARLAEAHAAEHGPLRYAGVELSTDGDRVVLRLPSGHTEELRGVVAVRLGQQMDQLGQWAQDVEESQAEGRDW